MIVEYCRVILVSSSVGDIGNLLARLCTMQMCCEDLKKTLHISCKHPAANKYAFIYFS